MAIECLTHENCCTRPKGYQPWFASDDDFTSAISEKWAISMEENQVVSTLNAVA
jgi:hypothetical protein